MSGDIDIHQLDVERQVLFILKEDGDYFSVQQIRDKLIDLEISPEEKAMRSFLNSLRDNRRKLLKDGLIHKTSNGYKIMRKGIEYLNNTVIVVDPSGQSSVQEAIGGFLSKLSGHIKLCDPYFDDTAYSILKRHLPPNKLKSIKVIYANNRINPATNYRIDNISIELKKKNNIHDRFIIDSNHLYFIGTSLNNIGNKLSFIFNLTVYKTKFDEIFQGYWSKS